MRISLLPDLGTESAAMNKERQEVHLCPAHVAQRGSSVKAWGLWGLSSHHPASARDKVMVRPRSCSSCWGHVHRVGTTLTLKLSLCSETVEGADFTLQVLWAIPVSLKICSHWRWRQIPADINGVRMCPCLWFFAVVSFVAVDPFLY